LELANYVGGLTHADPWCEYEWIGAENRQRILSFLPQDWSFEGRRVLDFGGGSGRVIRHFVEESQTGEFWCCDIDPASVEWAQANLSPPFHFLRNAEWPPLDQPDATFDLIYGISVFTHLTDSWSAWLLELHRLLREGGFLILSFLGEGIYEQIARERYDDERVGANQIEIAKPWPDGGPSVMHSPWWLRAHWGRAFEIVDLVPYTDRDQRLGHGLVVMRKDERPVPSIEELERPEPGEPREDVALRHNVEQLRQEVDGPRRWWSLTRHRWSDPVSERERLKRVIRAR
jgi:SAM-dependent methyltransferase